MSTCLVYAHYRTAKPDAVQPATASSAAAARAQLPIYVVDPCTTQHVVDDVAECNGATQSGLSSLKAGCFADMHHATVTDPDAH